MRKIIITLALVLATMGVYVSPALAATVPPLHGWAPAVDVWEDGSARYADGWTFDPDTRTFDPPADPLVIVVNVAAGEDTPESPEGMYANALGRALLSAGYVGTAGDACACIYVPVGASVDVPGWGVWTAEL